MKISKTLLDQINAAPKELQDFIHEMESWDHSSKAYELFQLREEVKAQAWLIQKLRKNQCDCDQITSDEEEPESWAI